MKTFLIGLIVVIILSGVALWGLYSFNNDFQVMANSVLSLIPGSIGNHFRLLPTPQDVDAQVTTIASYLLSLERTRAIDKLKLIEAEDTNAYQSVVRSMVRLNPLKTERILEDKRRMSLKSSIVQSTLDQIEQEQSQNYSERAEIVSALPLQLRIKEIQEILNTRIDGYEYVAQLFSKMPIEKYSEVLPFLNTTDVQGIYSAMSETAVLNTKAYLSEVALDQNKLDQTAKIMFNKSIAELVTLFADTSTYTVNEQVRLLETLGPKRSGQVLSKITDGEHIFNIVNGIQESQMLYLGVDNFTPDLLKALNIFKEYDDNMSELVNIYSRMDDQKIADIIRRLYWNTGQVQRYSLENGEQIVFSDEKLAIDLLKSFNAKKIASVLSYLDNSISTELSTKLALPSLE